MKLRPVKSHTELDYQCPNCGSIVTTSHTEVVKIGRAMCVVCDKVLEFEPFTVIARFSGGSSKTTQPKKPVRQQSTKPNPKDYKSTRDMMGVLMSMGHGKGAAHKIVNGDIDAGWDLSDPADFIQRVTALKH